MMGKGYLTYPGARPLAVCDVDQHNLQQAQDITGPDVKGHTDYREVLRRDDIDIVHIATPIHWHGEMAVDAAEVGQGI